MAVNTDAGEPGVNDFLIFEGAPRTLSFEANGETVENTLVPGQWELDPGNVQQDLTSGTWDVIFNGVGNVFLGTSDMAAYPTIEPGFALNGGSGWNLFRPFRDRILAPE